jgi:hypothetical protein
MKAPSRLLFLASILYALDIILAFTSGVIFLILGVLIHPIALLMAVVFLGLGIVLWRAVL